VPPVPAVQPMRLTIGPDKELTLVPAGRPYHTDGSGIQPLLASTVSCARTSPHMAAALVAWGCCQRSRSRQRLPIRQLFVACRASTGSPEQVEELKVEAARLRAEVAEFKMEKEKQRMREQELLFNAFDRDGSGAVDLQELRRGLQENWNIELDEAMVAKLLAAYDGNKDGLLEREDFDLGRMQATYEDFREETRADEAAQAKKREERAQRQAVLEEYLSSLPKSNEDTGLLTRGASVLAYLLPLLDSVRFAKPLARELPQLKPFYAVVASDVQILDQVSYGLAPLLLFIVFQGLANNTNIPKLLRFNMRQSVLLTISLFIPGVIGAIVNFVAKLALGTTNEWGEWTPGKVPQSIADPCGSAVVLVLLGCVFYSMGSSLLGVAPVGIPFISAEAERTMAKTRDSETEVRLQRQLQEAEKQDERATKQKRPPE